MLAATNRPEILDPALLRPGRFDRRLTVNPPDKDGRSEILEIHTRSVPLADDVDLDRVASSTPGMVGADLRNLVNEAALIAARRDHKRGPRRRLRRRARAHHPRRRAADHAVGRGARAHRLPRVRPRGARHARARRRPRAQGLDRAARARARRDVPVAVDADRYGYDASYLEGRIVGALGGRAAEELVYGNVTTGAESDLEQVTSIARQMVGRWGMSDVIGLVSVLPGAGRGAVLRARRARAGLRRDARARRPRGPADRRGLLRARRGGCSPPTATSSSR